VKTSLVLELKHKVMTLKAIKYARLFSINSSFTSKIFGLGLVLALSLHSFSQEMAPKDSLTSDHYLKKSTSQKIAGFVFLGIGATTLAVLSKGETDFDALPVLAIGGLTATLISVPLFISSGKNKRKAASLSVKKENAFLLRNRSVTQISFPAISVKFNLDH